MECGTHQPVRRGVLIPHGRWRNVPRGEVPVEPCDGSGTPPAPAGTPGK